MQSVEAEGKTVEEAVENALNILGLKREQVDIEILSESNRKLFRLIGAKGKISKVRVTCKEDEAQSEVKSMVENILRLMQFEVAVECRRVEEGYLAEISGAEEALVIGRAGSTLEALQYLANRMFHRIRPDAGRVILDVEGYREKREESLRSMALRMAEKVKKNQEAETLEPLNPHERRIIHLTLQDFAGVKTFSRGEGFWRQLVIAPEEQVKG